MLGWHEPRANEVTLIGQVPRAVLAWPGEGEGVSWRGPQLADRWAVVFLAAVLCDIVQYPHTGPLMLCDSNWFHFGAEERQFDD